MVYMEMLNTIDVSCTDIDRKMGSIKRDVAKDFKR